MEQAQALKAAPVASLKPNQAFIVGRIDSHRTFEQSGKRVHEHRVIQPAEDEYSSPGAVLVHASYKLGGAGDDVKAHVHVTGWRDSYKDREGNSIQTARNALRVVE